MPEMLELRVLLPEIPDLLQLELLLRTQPQIAERGVLLPPPAAMFDLDLLLHRSPVLLVWAVLLLHEELPSLHCTLHSSHTPALFC